MSGRSVLQGCLVLATVLAAALFAAWRIRRGIRRERDIFVLIGGTLALILLALAQMALLIARGG